MGMMSGIMTFLFGDGRNVLADTAEVFRENAEQGAIRQADAKTESLQQFAAEFARPPRGVFDRIVDAMNRLPRPMLALGTIWLFVLAMQSPEQFSEGMAGLALVPEPLWWLMGAIVSFYFGARHQAKTQDFQRSVAATLALRDRLVLPVETAKKTPTNAALMDWQVDHGQ